MGGRGGPRGKAPSLGQSWMGDIRGPVLGSERVDVLREGLTNGVRRRTKGKNRVTVSILPQSHCCSSKILDSPHQFCGK